MEKHDLVRTFQDILHGLLISKPEDPFAYLEEHAAHPPFFLAGCGLLFVLIARSFGQRQLFNLACGSPMATGCKSDCFTGLRAPQYM